MKPCLNHREINSLQITLPLSRWLRNVNRMTHNPIQKGRPYDAKDRPRFNEWVCLETGNRISASTFKQCSYGLPILAICATLLVGVLIGWFLRGTIDHERSLTNKVTPPLLLLGHKPSHPTSKGVAPAPTMKGSQSHHDELSPHANQFGISSPQLNRGRFTHSDTPPRNDSQTLRSRL